MPRNLILDESIHARKVRLIDEGGEQVDVISKNGALNQAADADLDLVLISPNAKSPVARITGCGRYRFEQQEKFEESHRKSKTVNVKEIRLSPTIEDNDFDAKLDHIQKFLGKEDTKVRVSIHFRGRAITHTELGLKALEKMADATKDIANITAKPKVEGRSIFLILAPKDEKDRK